MRRAPRGFGHSEICILVIGGRSTGLVTVMRLGKHLSEPTVEYTFNEDASGKFWASGFLGRLPCWTSSAILLRADAGFGVLVDKHFRRSCCFSADQRYQGFPWVSW